jgi:hypothetical protein
VRANKAPLYVHTSPTAPPPAPLPHHNAALDAALIFGAGLGVRGAALATVLAQV